ncbi:hypothetical protein EU803_16365 [Loktanella sp. IMCC34160]|uniref:hypothetical protein n=1 Tax=Loktanella sp. IMCC34160 TaxID=2510646 RepID=UPI00101BC64A|nr:hypothetical protein [Loktanella sp. IMCC34160]RYG89726.1 hypothetical protein EU803_16365 [Loktanella sp. IMCC34160]
MGMKFLASRGTWRQMGDVNIIRETQMGWHPTQLFFPGVSSCTTITFRLNSGRLMGMHLTIADSTADFDNLLSQVEAGSAGGVHSIYHVGALTSSGSGWNSKSKMQWGKQAKAVRKQVGNKGLPSYFLMTPSSGVDVRMTTTGAGVTCETRAENKAIPFNTTDGWTVGALTPA